MANSFVDFEYSEDEDLSFLFFGVVNSGAVWTSSLIQAILNTACSRSVVLLIGQIIRSCDLMFASLVKLLVFNALVVSFPHLCCRPVVLNLESTTEPGRTHKMQLFLVLWDGVGVLSFIQLEYRHFMQVSEDLGATMLQSPS